MVFDKDWFKRHQTILLWFANTFIGRRILCLKTSSVGRNKIIQILPNSITWKEGKCFKTEFRTHDKFSKRLYYAFKPFWYLLHLWDIAFYPNFNLGFDSLTAYPAAGAASPVDGRAYRGPVDEDLATIRAGAGSAGSATDATETCVYCSSTGTLNQYQYLVRSFFLFDTSSIPDIASIDAAVFSLFSTNTYFQEFTGTAPELDVVASTPAANDAIASTDYGNIGSTPFGSLAFSSWVYTPTPQYNDIAFNATGIAAISKTGITKLGTRINWDTDNSLGTSNWVASKRNELGVNFADQAGTTNDPKLVVTYSLPGGGFIFISQ